LCNFLSFYNASFLLYKHISQSARLLLPAITWNWPRTHAHTVFTPALYFVYLHCYLIQWSRFLLEKLTLLSWSRNSLSVMKPKRSPSCSENPIIIFIKL
jgi:hypothetical protein